MVFLFGYLLIGIVIFVLLQKSHNEADWGIAIFVITLWPLALLIMFIILFGDDDDDIGSYGY